MTTHIFNNPQAYSKNNALQYNFAMKLLNKMHFANNARVLDIGCGDGSLTCEIARIVTDGCVIGTDMSTTMIDYASKNFANQNNLRFLSMDAANNIFREQFDIVTSFNCLHWVKDQENALKGISISATPGAQIALLLSHRKSLYHAVLDTLCNNDKWSRYFIEYVNPRSFFDPNVYKEWIKNSNLELTELLEEEMIYTFESKTQLKAFFAAAGSQINYIPDARKNEFLNEFVDEYVKLAECCDEFIPVRFWCLQIIAFKPTLVPTIKDSLMRDPKIFSRL